MHFDRIHPLLVSPGRPTLLPCPPSLVASSFKPMQCGLCGSDTLGCAVSHGSMEHAASFNVCQLPLVPRLLPSPGWDLVLLELAQLLCILSELLGVQTCKPPCCAQENTLCSQPRFLTLTILLPPFLP